MQKPASTNIAATNIANYGSEDHHDLKESAAKKEPAFEGAGQQAGVEQWRIEKFAVKRVDKKMIGSFFSGDSYIVLNTYKKGQALRHNVHFWLGKSTTQDEAGTAAYKTVELDDLLRDLPVQYREVQGHESAEFISCFKGVIRVMDGGIDSAFNIVKPEDYKPRLFHVKGRTENGVAVGQVPCERKSLNEGDTFILDLGLKIYQFDGTSAGFFEKRKGEEVVNALLEERNGKPKKFNMTSSDDDADFWNAVGGKGPVPAAIPDTKTVKQAIVKKLFQLSDASGKLTFKEVASGSIPKSALKSEDAFILDCESGVYAWIGTKTTQQEKKKAIQYATEYLTNSKRSAVTPVLRVIEGFEPATFLKELTD